MLGLFLLKYPSCLHQVPLWKFCLLIFVSATPLGVSVKRSGKPRLILDLHYVNQHLRSCKFKYEDVRTTADLFHKGDRFYKFDYTSSYHHLEIFQVIPLFWAFRGGLTVTARSPSYLLASLLALTSSQKSREP